MFDKKPFAWVVVLLTLHSSLLVYSAAVHSPTMLEPAFVVAGISHWEFQRFELFRVNPPLPRMVAAIPVVMTGYNMDWRGFYDSPRARPEFLLGARFVSSNEEHIWWLITFARWACIPFSICGGLFCYFWSRDFWESNQSGLVSLFLWCFSPNILAHAELVTADCAATSLGLGACYMFWRWIRNPGWSKAFPAALLLGLALLSKTTMILLPPLWCLIWLISLSLSKMRCSPYQHTLRRTAAIRGSVATQFVQLFFIFLFATSILNLGYGFDGTFTRTKSYDFVSSTFTGKNEFDGFGNRFSSTWLGELPIPFPKQFVRGIDLQKCDFEDYQEASYLHGEWKQGGWWYYYLYGLAVKMPHGFQALLVMSTLLLITQKPKSLCGIKVVDLCLLLFPAVAVLSLVSFQLEFNIHFRYVLPALGFLAVYSGGATGKFQYLKSETSDSIHLVHRFAVLVSLVYVASSTLCCYPHQLAYFNEASGGPSKGWRHMLGSSLDWGQDYLLVKNWQDERKKEYPEASFLLWSAATYPPESLGVLNEKSRTSRQYIIIGRSLESRRTHKLPETSKRETIGYTHVVYEKIH